MTITYSKFLKFFTVVLFSLILASCSSKKPTGEVSTAAIPLNDLNLVKAKIPAVLKDAKRNPYAIPEDQSCEALNKMILALDEVLIADFDSKKFNQKDSDNTKKATSKALSGAVADLVPFRSWLRKLSGAERHSRKVVAAIAAGISRRAFIKGVRSTKQCQ